MISIISEYLNKQEKRCIVKENESLKDYCTFKIGGTAELLVMPENCGTLIDLIRIIKEQDIKYYILGNGSNVLIADKYFGGVFIVLTRMNNIEVRGDYIHAECGASLNKLAGIARDNNLSGLEFAYGIPGTLGGAVYMNAGAYGGQMSDVIYSSEYLDLDNLEIKKIDAQAHEFGYRHSIFDENKLILGSVLKLNYGDKSEIEALMLKNMAARKDKQPLEYASAGSIFKRGGNYFAAKVIDECGLKGASVGGAQVSEKHAGFIINKRNASFNDVISLIEHVKSVVHDKTGIMLEREVKIIE
jgi:UDP-N-acetylmuramate dehydrogenase